MVSRRFRLASLKVHVARFSTAQVNARIGHFQAINRVVGSFLPGPALGGEVRDTGALFGSALNSGCSTFALHRTCSLHRLQRPAILRRMLRCGPHVTLDRDQ